MFCPNNLQVIYAIKLLAFLSPSDPGSLGSFARFSMDFSLCTDLIVLYWLLSNEASISSSGIKSATVLYTRFGSFHMNRSLLNLSLGAEGQHSGREEVCGGSQGKTFSQLHRSFIYFQLSTELPP